MTTEQTDIDNLVYGLHAAKVNSDDAKSWYEERRVAVSAAMQKDGATKWTAEVGTASIVTNEKLVLDEPGLLAALTPEQAAMVTVTSVDTKKLEAAVEVGAIDAGLASEFMTTAPASKPYLRYLARKG